MAIPPGSTVGARTVNIRFLRLLTVRTHGPYYTNSGYLPCACAHGPFSYTMVNYRATVRLTSRPNVSDQLTLLPVRAQTAQVGLLDKDKFFNNGQ